MRAPVVTRITPLQAIEGGRIAIDGEGFTVDGPELPEVRIGNAVMRVVYASPSRLSAIVPAGLDAGRVPVRIAGVAGATAYIDVAAPFAAGLHQVDSPVFDRAGKLARLPLLERRARRHLNVWRRPALHFVLHARACCHANHAITSH